MNGQLVALLIGSIAVIATAAPFLWGGIFHQGDATIRRQPQRTAGRRR